MITEDSEKSLVCFDGAGRGTGISIFLPKGMVLKNTLLDYWREIHNKAGYVEIRNSDHA